MVIKIFPQCTDKWARGVYSLEGKEERTGAGNQDARQVEDACVRCGH